MNDTNQPVTQPTTVPAANAHPPQSPVPTQASSSPGSVEREPVIGTPPITQESLGHPVPEIVVPPEVKEAGVDSSTHHEPTLSEEIKKAGVTVAAPVQQVQAEPSLKIQLPMSYAEAVAQEKQSKMKDAVKWIAALVMYQWRKLNPKLYK